VLDRWEGLSAPALAVVGSCRQSTVVKPTATPTAALRTARREDRGTELS
jgi:hypothetical protein